MKNSIILGSLAGFFIFSFSILENAHAVKEIDSRVNSTASSHQAGDSQGIIDPLFQPNPSENAEAGEKGIIDPLFRKSVSKKNVEMEEKGIIDPLFRPDPKNRRNIN